MESKNRIRGPNFTKSDCMLLCDIISGYKDAIENKKTDGVNLLEKNRAWQEVVRIYNSSTTGSQRTLDSLQQNYKNLKKKLKKSTSEAKMNITDSQEAIKLFTNDKEDFKKEPLPTVIQDNKNKKKNQSSEGLQKQSVSTKFISLASAKLELVALQKELLEAQLIEEREKIKHNRILRSMEIEDIKKKFEHNELLRTIELENAKLNFSNRVHDR